MKDAGVTLQFIICVRLSGATWQLVNGAKGWNDVGEEKIQALIYGDHGVKACVLKVWMLWELCMDVSECEM